MYKRVNSHPFSGLFPCYLIQSGVFAILIKYCFFLVNGICCRIEDFEILHGDHHGLSDTISFLKGLAELRALADPVNHNTHQSRESLAAAALFNWEVWEIYFSHYCIF